MRMAAPPIRAVLSTRRWVSGEEQVLRCSVVVGRGGEFHSAADGFDHVHRGVEGKVGGSADFPDGGDAILLLEQFADFSLHFERDGHVGNPVRNCRPGRRVNRQCMARNTSEMAGQPLGRPLPEKNDHTPRKSAPRTAERRSRTPAHAPSRGDESQAWPLGNGPGLVSHPGLSCPRPATPRRRPCAVPRWSPG